MKCKVGWPQQILTCWGILKNPLGVLADRKGGVREEPIIFLYPPLRLQN